MRNFTSEKVWRTAAGLNAHVIKHNSPPHFTHRCGYVEVDQNHGLYGIEYDQIDQYISVHGGLTFSGTPCFVQDDSYWFGYDCAHSCDKTYFSPNGIDRSLDFCIKECENLASQLNNKPLDLFYLAKKIGKLPLDQHNLMLSFGIQTPQDNFVKDYFELVSKIKV